MGFWAKGSSMSDLIGTNAQGIAGDWERSGEFGIGDELANWNAGIGQQQNYANQYLAGVNSAQGSVAAQQAQQNLAQAQRQAAAQAVGRGANPAAERAAAYGMGGAASAAIGQAAQLRAQEQQAARQAQIQAAQFGTTQTAAQAQMAQERLFNAQEQAYKAQALEEGQDAAQTQMAIGAGTSMLAAGAAVASDERLKVAKQKLGKAQVDAAVAGLQQLLGAGVTGAQAQNILAALAQSPGAAATIAQQPGVALDTAARASRTQQWLEAKRDYLDTADPAKLEAHLRWAQKNDEPELADALRQRLSDRYVAGAGERVERPEVIRAQHEGRRLDQEPVGSAQEHYERAGRLRAEAEPYYDDINSKQADKLRARDEAYVGVSPIEEGAPPGPHEPIDQPTPEGVAARPVRIMPQGELDASGRVSAPVVAAARSGAREMAVTDRGQAAPTWEAPSIPVPPVDTPQQKLAADATAAGTPLIGFQYDDRAKAAGAPEGQRIGTTAQAVEATPLGQQQGVVKEAPIGKVLDRDNALGMSLGLHQREDQRLRGVERQLAALGAPSPESPDAQQAVAAIPPPSPIIADSGIRLRGIGSPGYAPPPAPTPADFALSPGAKGAATTWQADGTVSDIRRKEAVQAVGKEAVDKVLGALAATEPKRIPPSRIPGDEMMYDTPRRDPRFGTPPTFEPPEPWTPEELEAIRDAEGYEPGKVFERGGPPSALSGAVGGAQEPREAPRGARGTSAPYARPAPVHGDALRSYGAEPYEAPAPLANLSPRGVVNDWRALGEGIAQDDAVRDAWDYRADLRRRQDEQNSAIGQKALDDEFLRVRPEPGRTTTFTEESDTHTGPEVPRWDWNDELGRYEDQRYYDTASRRWEREPAAGRLPIAFPEPRDKVDPNDPQRLEWERRKGVLRETPRAEAAKLGFARGLVGGMGPDGTRNRIAR